MYESARSKRTWQKAFLQAAFINLILVTLLGVLLRAFPFLPHVPFAYKNLLHGHSHFAFGGWVLPVLIGLVMQSFPELTEHIAVKHWRNIFLLTLFSAYGMLVFFPLYGYKGGSIFFSTLSIVATVYFSVVIWNATRTIEIRTSHLFLIWCLIYAVLSAVGPFATVPLVITGKAGTPIYFDLIYFYLHFQYNGFFTFIVFSLFYRQQESNGASRNGKPVFALLNASCIPAYALSILWHQPPIVFNIVGGFAAILQLVAAYFFWLDVKKTAAPTLLYFSAAAFTLKVILQGIGAFPPMAVMTYEVRNFVIAYLHLALLGFVSVAVFYHVSKIVKQHRLFMCGAALFLISFLTTESLLALQAMYAANLLTFLVPNSSQLLLTFSLPFTAGSLLMAIAVCKSYWRNTAYKSFLLKERTAKSKGKTIQASMTARV